ncbi:MAG TPA: endonuclease/exonuclease/phosphatase family protein [Gaiellaceae bacterium]
MIVRTWNLFNGNTVPPQRRAYLRTMVEMITADKPDIVCLQEIPAWALSHVGAWSGMKAVTARAKRPKLGPFPIPASLGKALTAPNHGVIRSAFAGQGNAILFPNDATVKSHKTITLNTNVFCEDKGRKLGMTPKEMIAWEKERRVCHFLQYELPNRRRVLVANLHATSASHDLRLPDAELRRAVDFVDRGSELEDAQIVAGDFNITLEQSTTIKELLAGTPETRWTDVGPGIDHVLLRRTVATSVKVWPEDERRFEGRLLSDHAPVEVVVEYDK